MRKKIFLIWITNIFACFTADFHIMDVVMLNRTFFIFVFYICGCRIFNRYFTSTAVKTWNETNINQVLTKAELYFSDFWTVFKYALWLSNFHFLCTCSPMDIVSSFIYKCYNTWTEVCIFIWQENLIFFLFYGKKKKQTVSHVNLSKTPLKGAASVYAICTAQKIFCQWCLINKCFACRGSSHLKSSSSLLQCIAPLKQSK